MIIKIEVKQDHINRGEPGEAMSCPIALALQDLGYKAATVEKRWIELEGAKTYTSVDEKRIRVPEVAQCFIRQFDDMDVNDEYVKPFTFEIDTDNHFGVSK